MDQINFFKLWHVEVDQNFKDILPGKFIKLDDIPCPSGLERLWPFLQEYRIHFAELDLAEQYTGFASLSFPQKFGNEANNMLTECIAHKSFVDADLSPIVISQTQWIHQVANYHVGMDKYVNQYAELCEIDKSHFTQPICYCNSFISKTSIYKTARELFKKNILQVFEMNNYNLDFSDGGYGPVRKGGCLSERLWGLTLSSVSKTYNPCITNIMWRNMVQ